jgi:hypothetical protein
MTAFFSLVTRLLLHLLLKESNAATSVVAEGSGRA